MTDEPADGAQPADGARLAADVDTERRRLIADPTRDRLLRHLVDAGVPLTVAALTDAVGLNHTTVREHLAKLRACGLVTDAVEAVAPGARTRGRPRSVYRATPDAVALYEHDGPYQRLAFLLLDALASGDDPVTVGRRAAVARVADAGSPVATFTRELMQQGFAPVAVDDGELVLERCPYAAAAGHDPATVCRLHLGLVRGLADAIGELAVDDLVAVDPVRGGCRVRLRATAP
jgi:predicted ArsR family transcriptional regulator